MTDFLVKHFIKNHEQYENPSVRTAYGIFASTMGIICNIILFLIKLSVGLLLGSVSVMADAFNNLSDAAASVVSFVGVKMASKPADKDHPFGHGRMEYIAALLVAFLVVEVGLSFLETSIDKIRNPQTLSFSAVSVAVLLASTGLKLWLGALNRKLGRKINSSVMKATAADAFGDVLATLATIVSVSICHFTDFYVDGFMGLAVSVLIILAGINIVKDTLTPLIGEAVNPELCAGIVKLVESYDGILGTHDLIVHKYGPSKTMASIHAEVSNREPIEKSHEIIDRIEREVSKQLDVLLVIHMDPLETEDEEVLKHKEMVEEVLEEIDSALSFHDFRMVAGEKQINLIFDLVVPYEYDKKGQLALQERVAAAVAKRDERCQCVMTIENSFTPTEGE